MQLVTPSDVQSAVSTVTMICRIVFQVSFFIFFIPFFLVNNPVSVSGIPLPAVPRHPVWQRAPSMSFIDDAKIQHFLAKCNSCPGSCDVRHEIPFDRAAISCVPTQEILRGDAGIATWRRRKRGEEGERDQRKR